MRQLLFAGIVTVGLLAPVAAVPGAEGQATAPAQAPTRRPDVIFVPTREPVRNAMLKMANVTKDDVVYDLGCGDGQIVIAAARLGARAVGVDIDPQRIAEATANVKAAGVQDRVTLILGDIFDPSIKISEATVVTLYLLQSLNEKLAPRLKAELRPGTRIVSHAFSMGTGWPAERTEQVDGTNIHFWTIPKN